MRVAARLLCIILACEFIVRAQPGYDYARPPAQPANEAIDLAAYAKIRDEGLNHSRIMEYASGLLDGIGSRLTGSPNLDKAEKWTQEQFKVMGCSNVHLESWGEFGMGWRQIVSWVAMAKPDTAVFVAQATPWSPPTKGSITADVIAVPSIKEEKDLAQWKGKLAGKIVLYGDPPKVDPNAETPVRHFDAAKLREILEYPLNGDMSEQYFARPNPEEHAKWRQSIQLAGKLITLLNAEHPAAILRHAWGGGPGVLRDDNGEILGLEYYRPDHRQVVPSAVVADEAFGRMSRLLQHNVPVSVMLNIETEFTGEHVEEFNSIAEIAGTDPNLKDQVVMAGGHLDSWPAGTGATDNGAGSLIAIEAMRILNAIALQPRRAIRVALWSGEEQGEFGSRGYVKSHFGSVGLSTDAEELALPEYARARGSVKREAAAGADFGLFQSGQRRRQNSGHLHREQCRNCTDIRAMDCALAGFGRDGREYAQ